MADAYDKFVASFADKMLSELRADHDGTLQIESPIERVFLLCFLAAWRAERDLNGFEIGRFDVATTVMPQGFSVMVGRQIRALDWPVDFVILVRSVDSERRISRLAVECDGHEFHERTKEQAMRDRARDRRLQAAGFTVMRFTGAELYRDPMGCVSEVLRWCLVRLFEGGEL